MKKIILISFLTILSVFFVSCNISEQGLAVDANDESYVDFEIYSGNTTKTIAKNLEEAGLIRSQWAFKEIVKENNFDGKLQAGKYKLSKSMDLSEIVKILGKGKVYIETTKVVIPEGYEFNMIVSKLVEQGLIDEEKFKQLANEYDFKYRFLSGINNKTNRLEGYLFPATYNFEKGIDELGILKIMLDKFDSVFKDEYYDRADELGMSVNEIVTLASIIEREGAKSDEFPIISGVFHNRLKDRMLLQSCATVQYVIGERKPVLSNKDIKIESPFNTYKYEGLPPYPIASPGEMALKAALYPEDTQYYYFVVSGKGDNRHIFSKTLKEHEKAIREGIGSNSN